MIKYPEDFKKFVRKCVQSYTWYLKVQHYTVELFFEKQAHKDDEGETKKTAASIDVDTRYLKADIKVYPRLLEEWKFKNKREIEQVIAHELSHILTQPLFDLTQTNFKTFSETRDVWESLTERIGRLTHKLAELDMKKR